MGLPPDAARGCAAAATPPCRHLCRLVDHHAPPLISYRADLHLQAAAAMAGPASGKLFGACVLERLPVVVPEDPDWELEYRAWQAVRGAAAAGSSLLPLRWCLALLPPHAGTQCSLRCTALHRSFCLPRNTPAQTRPAAALVV